MLQTRTNPVRTPTNNAFMVEPDEFDRALAIMKARGIETIKYTVTFPGRHAFYAETTDGLNFSLMYGKA